MPPGRPPSPDEPPPDEPPPDEPPPEEPPPEEPPPEEPEEPPDEEGGVGVEIPPPGSGVIGAHAESNTTIANQPINLVMT